MIFLSVGCQEEKTAAPAPVLRPGVFEVVVSDLVTKDAINAKFVGSKAMVVSRWNEGDSLFYSLDDYAVMLSSEMLEALQNGSESKDPFPATEVFGPHATLTSEGPCYYLDYFGDDVEPVQAKCYVRFWRPGYTKDRKHAIVRAWYGPKSHDCVLTYVLADSEVGWKILVSYLCEYP